MLVNCIISVKPISEYSLETIFRLHEELEGETKASGVDLFRHLSNFRDAELLFNQLLCHCIIATSDLRHAYHFLVRLKF